MSAQHTSISGSNFRTHNDRIVVIGGSERTLDLLRVATIRSEDIVLVGASFSEAVLRFTARFAIETRPRIAEDSDVREAASLLVSIGDIEAENTIVRSARRHGIPIFVSGRRPRVRLQADRLPRAAFFHRDGSLEPCFTFFIR